MVRRDETTRRARETTQEERRTRVAELMMRHLKQDEIAREVGVAQGTVSKDIAKIRAEWAEQRALTFEQHVAEQLARLAKVEGGLWERVLGGDLDATDRWLRLAQERAKILGLYAPKEMKVLTEDALDAELVRLTEEMKRLDGALSHDAEGE